MLAKRLSEQPQTGKRKAVTLVSYGTCEEIKKLRHLRRNKKSRNLRVAGFEMVEHIGDSRMRENRHNSTQKARFSTCQAENPMPRKWHQMAPFSLPNGTKWHLFFKAPHHADSHRRGLVPPLCLLLNIEPVMA